MRQNKKERPAIGELELVRRKLERWRIGHKGKRKRIPEELWREAAQLAVIHGVAAVASRLRLDYYSLKTRSDHLPHPSHREEKKPKFIEVTPLTVGKKAVSKIEFEKPCGSKLRIEFEGGLTQELTKLSESLWRAAR